MTAASVVDGRVGDVAGDEFLRPFPHLPHRAGPWARNGLSDGAANVGSSNAAARSTTCPPYRTPTRAVRPRARTPRTAGGRRRSPRRVRDARPARYRAGPDGYRCRRGRCRCRSFAALGAAERERVRPAPLPETSAAMLATLTDERFSDPRWISERKLDGVRCLARPRRRGAGAAALTQRQGHDRDLSRGRRRARRRRPTDSCVDGEIVAFEGRRTSFARLQGRLGITTRTPRWRSGIPVFYYVYDVLHLDGHDVAGCRSSPARSCCGRPWTLHDPLRFTFHRREAAWGDVRAACARGDEGVIAKRADAPYPGGRSTGLAEVQVRARPGVRRRRVDRPARVPGPTSAHCWSATTTATAFASPARSGPASTGARSPTCPPAGRPRGRHLAVRARPGQRRERDVHWVRPGARRPDRLRRVDPRRPAAPPALPGTAGGQAGRRRRARDPLTARGTQSNAACAVSQAAASSAR